MANIRIKKLNINSSTEIEVIFTAKLDANIHISNISIEGMGNISNLTITSVSVLENYLTINVRPMIPKAQYKLTLSSSETQTFKGANNERFLEDGKTNIEFFIGYPDENVIRNNIFNNITDVYNKEYGSLIYNSIDIGAEQMRSAFNLIKEVGAANYISVEVENEMKIRGSGPYDRLDKEGAFEVTRVATTESGITDSKNIYYSEFPSDPVSLQQVLITSEIVSNSSNNANNFTGLDLTLEYNPIIKVESIILVRNLIEYVYDISQYKYGLKDSKYDTNNAYSSIDLEDNQIRLNNSAIGTSFPFPQGSDTFKITYYYKKSGRIIDPTTLIIADSINVIRESVPSIATSFFLDHAPIVDSNGNIPTLNGITWLDPAQNFDSDEDHPAFINEVRYNEISLPSIPGEYSVDYNTGRVFVYGVDGTGTDGTTTVPPVATYKFRKTFQEGLDYYFFSDLNEVASISGRDLRGEEGTINFYYEDTFANNEDFIFSSHIEVIDERINNRLIDNIGIETLYNNVNEVFRVYNETTGEIYIPTRINNNEIYFTSTTPPRTKNIFREAVRFENIIQSQIVVADRISITGKSFIAFKIELSNDSIGSSTENFIGASFNSSLSFSDENTFINEMYFNSNDNIDGNLIRLKSVGDYMVDYPNGIVYVGVNLNASTDIGDATYKYAVVKTRNKHITRVDDIYRSTAVNVSNSRTYNVGTISDTVVEITDLETAGTKYYQDSYGDNHILTVYSEKIQTNNNIWELNHIYQVTDLHTTYNPIDFSDGATISHPVGSNYAYVTLDTEGVIIKDNNLIVKTSGSRNYIDAERLDNLHSLSLAQLISAVNVIDSYNNINYFAQGTDGYVSVIENRIYLPTGVSISGTTVDAVYKAQLLNGAAVIIDYNIGDMFIDYTYCKDEILISYEYGNNSLDWSISSSLNKDDTYYVTYKYGALRNSLRDNFGVLSGLDELTTIPDNLSREIYRDALQGSLQSFPKGPTIPSLKTLVNSMTQIDPNIIEEAFSEWIIGRDFLNLIPMKLDGYSDDYMPSYSTGKFGDGLLLNKDGQSAVIPASSNIKFSEGTWEAFITPEWDGIDNDASLTFDIYLNNLKNINKVYIGSNADNPSSIPFTVTKNTENIMSKPNNIHNQTGYFIWYDSTLKYWRMRVRAPMVTQETNFSGTIYSSGDFYAIKKAETIEGYDGYEGFSINEVNDKIYSSTSKIKYSFTIDSYDILNTSFDSYDSYAVGVNAAFDGIDFRSDDNHYLFDTGVKENYCRMSLYKDGKGFLRFKIYDDNNRVKMLTSNIQDWEKNETYFVACSWKINTIEQRDEMHLFIDGYEQPNTYKFRGFLDIPSGTKFLDTATEILLLNATSPTIGGFDLSTIAGSNVITSVTANFSTISIGSRFLILDNTDDGINTQNAPYVYIKDILGQNQISLIDGNGNNYNCISTLDNVKYSINPRNLKTSSDPDVEKVKIYSIDSSGNETELYSPNTLIPQYAFTSDGYLNYISIYDGILDGYNIVSRSFGLIQSRCHQYTYIWPNLQTNVINTIMPPPTFVSKVNITSIIVKKISIDGSLFALISTDVGGHLVPLFLSSNLDYCQPSNSITGRKLSIRVEGSNIDFSGINEVAIIGTDPDGYYQEIVTFDSAGIETTDGFFTTITDIVAVFSATDTSKTAGILEIKEANPLNWQENNGDYAEVHLSIQQQAGNDGYAYSGQSTITDSYSRFGAEDIGKTFNIISPSAIANTYTITDVSLDPSGVVKDSNTVVLNTTWTDDYGPITWKMLSTSYGDSGFSNGLITLEKYGTGGSPFLLRSCWYEVDFPTYLTIPFTMTSEYLYIGSDMYAQHQANAVIDEMRILDEMSLDTDKGVIVPSSGRSITTDSLIVEEFSNSIQTLGLFHFNNSIDNYASFYSSFSNSYKQSENSVNSLFNQSAVFNEKKSLEVDNKSIFNNDKGTIEFWISPILDTYNDPTYRYYIDLSTERQLDVIASSALTIVLPTRARSISSVLIEGDDTNYFTGGSLSTSGYIITLGQALPANIRAVTVIYTPITNQGDRFSIYKDDNGFLNLLVTASNTDFQIRTTIYWKKNSWHRVFVGWDLNNTDNQDILIMMVDGIEAGTIRYGTGLKYGVGHVYGSPTVWGSATTGTISARNILADINLIDIFNTINIGADFTGQYTALAKMDNIRFSSELRNITYVGGTGPGQLIGRDLLYTSNINTAQPVISDALTRLLLDFDTEQEIIENLSVIRDDAVKIFDFYIKVIDTFYQIDLVTAHNLLTSLINKLKPAHTRAFISYTK